VESVITSGKAEIIAGMHGFVPMFHSRDRHGYVFRKTLIDIKSHEMKFSLPLNSRFEYTTLWP